MAEETKKRKQKTSPVITCGAASVYWDPQPEEPSLFGIITNGVAALANRDENADDQKHASMTGMRWVRLITTFAVLCCFGLIYAWSLFIEPLESEFGWARSETSLIFTISCITVCLGMVVAGFLERRLNCKAVMVIAAVLVVAGFIASSNCTSLPEIFVFYGVLVGLGVGIGFNCAIDTTLKWFPDKQGIASGFMLMGYGAGAMVLSPIVTVLLETFDWRTTFIILAFVFFAVILLCTVPMKTPKAEDIRELVEKAKSENIVSEVDYTPKQIIKMPVFWIAFVWLSLATSGGLALISQAVPAALEILAPEGNASAEILMTATAAMASVSLCNGLGRLLNGFIWDKMGYRVSFTWISLAFAAGMLMCMIAIEHGEFLLLVAGFALLGLMFGGTMSATSAIIGTFFGTRHFGINYAIMCCQMIPAAFAGPTALALAQSASGSYVGAFLLFFGIAVLTFVTSFLVRKPKNAEH